MDSYCYEKILLKKTFLETLGKLPCFINEEKIVLFVKRYSNMVFWVDAVWLYSIELSPKEWIFPYSSLAEVDLILD